MTGMWFAFGVALGVAAGVTGGYYVSLRVWRRAQQGLEKRLLTMATQIRELTQVLQRLMEGDLIAEAEDTAARRQGPRHTFFS